jgi:diguanylate cyclase (GGDEF)-like protein
MLPCHTQPFWARVTLYRKFYRNLSNSFYNSKMSVFFVLASLLRSGCFGGLLLFCLSVLPTPAAAQSTPHAPQSLNLTNHLEKLDPIRVSYIASDASLSFVKDLHGWQPYLASTVLTRSVWLRIEPLQLDLTSNRALERRYLSITRRALWQAQLYLPPFYQAQPLSVLTPPANMGNSPANFLIPISPHLQNNAAIYLKIERGRWNGDIQLGTLPALLQEEAAYRDYAPFFLGILCFGFVFAVVMFLHFREWVYLMFGGYVLATVLFLLVRTGNFFEFNIGLSLGAWYGQGVSAISICLLFLMALRFAITMSDLKQYTPRLYLLGEMLFVALLLVLMMILLGIEFNRHVVMMLNLLFLSIIVYTLIACSWAIYQKSRYAVFTLIGQSVLLPVALIMTLVSLDIVQIDFDAERFWLPFGYAVEIMVFATGLCDRALAFKRQRDQAYQLAMLDKLTNVANRHALSQTIQQLDQLPAWQRPFYFIALLDIDHFKRINDTYGHSAGDQCLQQMCAFVKNCITEDDQLFRYGGEEFVLVIYARHFTVARARCRLIRQHIKRQQMDIDKHRIGFTISLGLAALADFSDCQNAMAAADKALYRSKQNGRDRLTLADHSMTENTSMPHVAPNNSVVNAT